MVKLLTQERLCGICLMYTYTTDREGYARLDIDSIIEIVFEELRQMMKTGDPEFNIPVLDPYEFEYTHVDLSGSTFSLSANITEGIFSGASGFQINQFNIFKNELALECEIHFPTLNFSSGYYEMEGNIKEAIPLAGKGIIHVEVYDFNLRSKIYFKRTDDGKSILVDRFEKPQFSIRHIVSKTTYDENIDDIANAMVEDLLAGYINRFNRYLAETFSGPIIEALNSVLGKFSSANISFL
ncbi:uncharacterized protein LOC126381806 [Pectinophora gossypiella]|uniref:uncharacterized protein LOC126381806 n=1 Tax=Pectinophora gossypiella TaxID=13191 RepID=UPI00214E1AAB|nr:uncharacterized protein LOC126381806 [Pectinophora gossypiella]